MSDAPVTLGTLLWDGSSREGASALLDAVKDNAPQGIVKLPALQWKEIAQAVEDQVAAGFDVSLGTILVRSWSDLADVRAAADARRTPRDTTRCVPLADHSIDSVHHPKLEITIEGITRFELTFEVKLALKIRGAILSIRNARIREIGLGDCHGEAVLSCSGKTLHRYELGSVKFPGQIRFPGDGMALPFRQVREPARRY